MRASAAVLPLASALALLGASCAGAAADRPALPAHPRTAASDAFWERWGRGDAELSTYRGTISRYGEPRPAEQVLVYVTEPLDRETLIKDDEAPSGQRVQVLKLNSMLRFQTGIYPYSVMTSVFSPVDGYFAERFAPAKITLTAQEWCGHVFAGVWPGGDRFFARGASYFASEGERDESVDVPEGALYEDALLVQLRELDGDFAGGGAWSGALVPSLWRARREHFPLAPVDATITRDREGDVTRFTLRAGEYERVFEVEAGGDRRVLGWSTNQGEEMRVVATERMRYWELNGLGDERARERIGLAREVAPGLLPEAPTPEAPAPEAPTPERTAPEAPTPDATFPE